jgi:ABC-type multidrug transport system ATPase subunit
MKIESANLGKRFNREWVFRHFNFDSEEGKTYVILGPNGSGKSTLLQTLMGISPPSEGTLTYFSGEKQISAEVLYKHIAMCAPYQDLIDEFTLVEMMNFHFKFKKCLTPLEAFLDQTELSHAAHKFIGTFSSGMKQRLKVALALYSECDLLFLDEPCTNMDNKAIEWYNLQLVKTKGDRTVFIASNQPHEYPETAISLNILGYK